MKKIYAVKKGYKTGIFTSWDEAKASIDGYRCAQFKGFNDTKSARAWLNEATKPLQNHLDNYVEIYVDGSFDKRNSDRSGYGYVIVQNKKIIAKISGSTKNIEGSNNVTGEVKAVLEALKFLIRKKIKDAIIYYDYQGIEAWITDAWKAKKTVAKSYRENYLKLVEANRLNVIFKKVKSHSGDKYNDMADQLAKAGLNISAKNQ